MLNEYSIEQRATQIFDARSKEYFSEVLICYSAGNHRSVVVMLWPVVVCDLLFNLQHLVDLYGDDKAKGILADIGQMQQDNERSSVWETKLVESVAEQTQLLDIAERENLLHLQRQRHLAAHPVVNANFQLHRPNRDTVRALVRNALGSLHAIVREDEIYDWFVNRENAALCDYASKPFEFVRKVIRNVEHYLAFANGLGNDGKPSLAMDNLKRLAGGAFSLHYVLLLAAANFPKPLFDHFVAQLESFLFYYIFTKTPTKKLERGFSHWADELRVIAECTDPVKQKVQINAFVADRFEKNMASKARELTDAFKRFTLYSMQQYRTRYLLARLTQYVEMAFSGVKTPGSLEPFTKLEIEHILLGSPTAELRAKWAEESPDAV